MFFVHLIEANLNQRSTEWFNPMDPFALITVDRKIKRTHKWEDDNTPWWDYEWYFRRPSVRFEMDITIMDDDWWEHDTVGTAILNIS